MTKDLPDPECQTFIEEGVSSEAIDLYDSICGSSYGYTKSRGEVLSQIFLEKAEELYGKEAVPHMRERYQRYQERLRSPDNDELT